MSDQPKPTPPKPAKVQKPKDWLPVKQIWFTSQMPMPGAPSAMTLRGDCTQENIARWQIDYDPAHRMFCVTHLTADTAKEPEIRMVMEPAVRCWEPLT